MLSTARLAFKLPGHLQCSSLISKPPSLFRNQVMFQHRQTAFRRAETKTLKERLLSPAGQTPFTIGKGVVAGSSLFGLGALCYYGMGLSKEISDYDRSLYWPRYVKERIRDTYYYFGLSLLGAAGTSFAVYRSPPLYRIMCSNSTMMILASLGALVATSYVSHSLPYPKDGSLGLKHVAWLAHVGLVGAFISPLAMLGGQLLIRAGVYTAGICGGLSLLAMCAPSGKFLTMGAPLGMGFGLVFASSLAGLFLPPTTALGAGLYSISLYGGLVIFSGLMLYNTQKAVRYAEEHPSYDPIDHAMALYMDVINIFVRIAIILAQGGSGRKK